MKTVKIRATGFIIGSIFFTAFFIATFSGPGFLYAVDEWLGEFEAVCSQTDDAMELTKDQLKQLIDRCDRLKPIIQKQDDIQKRVYLRRLDSCQALYKFMLESKDK